MLIPSRALGFIRSGLNGRFGVTVPNFGTGGTHDNPLLNDVEAGDEAAGVEFLLVVPAQFSSGVLTLRTDGSLSFTGAADGTYSQSTPLYVYTPGDAAPVRRYVSGTTDPVLTINVGSVLSSFTATLGAGYSVAAQHTATLAAGYGVEQAHTATLAAGYAVAAQQTATLDAAYAIRASQLSTLAAGYSVQASHSAALDAGYDVEQAAGSFTTTLAAGFAVQASHNATLSAAFGVRQSHGDTLNAGYAIRQSQSAALSAGYAVRAAHLVTLDAGYTVAFGGGGADPEAVWEGFALEAGLTPGAMLRIVMAAVSGRTEGIGTDTERYFSVDGSKPRITATFDSAGNRTTIVLDGSP